MTPGGLRRQSAAKVEMLLCVALVAAVASCNNDPVTGPGFVCDISNPVSEIVFESVSDVIPVHSPARLADSVVVVAHALNRVGGIRSDVPITFTSSDTTVAVVDDRGVVHARKPGTVRVTASTCGKSARSDFTVALVASTVQVKFDSTAIVAGDSVLVTARALQQGSGSPVPGARFTFSASTVAGVSLTQRSDSTAIIKTAGTSTGTVVVTATGEGVSGTGALTVQQRVVDVKLDTTIVVAGDSVTVRARAHPQGSAVMIAGAVFTFAASPSTGIVVTQRSDTTAIVKTSGSGPFVITASNLGVNGATTLTVVPRVFLGSLATSETGLDVGRDFGCGLITLGRLYCWGLNTIGQLGAVADSVCFEELSNVAPRACSLSPIRVAPQLTFASVSAGDQFACGIAGGKTYCWGDGSFGKLGNGKSGPAPAPSLITSGVAFSSVSAGGDHACALTGAGAAYCWGRDSVGQLGDSRRVNSTTPIPVLTNGGIASYTSISSGFAHTCAIDVNGNAYCWGVNSSGELGVGVAGGDTDTPQLVAGGILFKAISAGGDTVQTPGLPIRYDSHTCGIALNGAAFCWGVNSSGQLGNGSAPGANSSTPVAVSGGLTFSKISSGSRFTCGLTTSGLIYCWGQNADLQLGQGPISGANTDIGTPQQVTGGELPAGVTFVSVSAGRRHACGVGSDGNAYCWGSDVFGSLGNTLQAAFRGFPQKVATPP